MSHVDIWRIDLKNNPNSDILDVPDWERGWGCLWSYPPTIRVKAFRTSQLLKIYLDFLVSYSPYVQWLQLCLKKTLQSFVSPRHVMRIIKTMKLSIIQLILIHDSKFANIIHSNNKIKFNWDEICWNISIKLENFKWSKSCFISTSHYISVQFCSADFTFIQVDSTSFLLDLQ